LDLLEETGPLAVTSANRTGGAETLSDTAAMKVFGDEIPVYVEGVCPGGEASTVVDVTGAGAVVLREGPISV
jgi:tRNA A37 threonylcarbamoyladenosine synthetase subunit TsaC/SUA5/YrdC